MQGKTIRDLEPHKRAELAALARVGLAILDRLDAEAAANLKLAAEIEAEEL